MVKTLMRDCWHKFLQMLQKFGMDDSQGELCSTFSEKITCTVLQWHMYRGWDGLSKSFKTAGHVAISRIRSLNVLQLNSALWKMGEIYSLGLGPTLCAVHHKHVAGETFRTLEQSLFSVPSLLRSNQGKYYVFVCVFIPVIACCGLKQIISSAVHSCLSMILDWGPSVLNFLLP